MYIQLCNYYDCTMLLIVFIFLFSLSMFVYMFFSFMCRVKYENKFKFKIQIQYLKIYCIIAHVIDTHLYIISINVNISNKTYSSRSNSHHIITFLFFSFLGNVIILSPSKNTPLCNFSHIVC